MTHPNTDSVVERVARAWEGEYERWTMRTNKGVEFPFEVCRFDDSGLAGEFSEVHGFAVRWDAHVAFEEMRKAASARAAIKSLREPSEAMVDAWFTKQAEVSGEAMWNLMIDAALSEPTMKEG